MQYTHRWYYRKCKAWATEYADCWLVAKNFTCPAQLDSWNKSHVLSVTGQLAGSVTAILISPDRSDKFALAALAVMLVTLCANALR